MATAEDIDAFFDALVDGSHCDDTPKASQQQQQQQQPHAADGSSSSQAAPEGTCAGTEFVAGAANARPQLTGVAPKTGTAEATETSSGPATNAPSSATVAKEAEQYVPRSEHSNASHRAPGANPEQLQEHQSGQQPQQGVQQAAFDLSSVVGVAPELRPEPPYDFCCYSNTQQQQYTVDAEAHVAALCTSTQAVSRLIESKLKENEHMLFAVHENLTVGRYDDAVCFFERLQQNLFLLAMLADQQRGGVAEVSVEAQRQGFNSNKDYWTHEELQRLHHALRTPGQDLQQLATAVGSKTAAQIHSYLTQAADRHLMHRAAAGSAAAQTRPSTAATGAAGPDAVQCTASQTQQPVGQADTIAHRKPAPLSQPPPLQGVSTQVQQQQDSSKPEQVQKQQPQALQQQPVRQQPMQQPQQAVPSQSHSVGGIDSNRLLPLAQGLPAAQPAPAFRVASPVQPMPQGFQQADAIMQQAGTIMQPAVQPSGRLTQ